MTVSELKGEAVDICESDNGSPLDRERCALGSGDLERGAILQTTRVLEQEFVRPHRLPAVRVGGNQPEVLAGKVALLVTTGVEHGRVTELVRALERRERETLLSSRVVRAFAAGYPILDPLPVGRARLITPLGH